MCMRFDRYSSEWEAVVRSLVEFNLGSFNRTAIHLILQLPSFYIMVQSSEFREVALFSGKAISEIVPQLLTSPLHFYIFVDVGDARFYCLL